MNKMIKTVGLSLVVLSSSFFAQAAEAAQKIGYINTAQVFQALPQREAVSKKLQNEFKDKSAELQGIQSQIKSKLEKLKRDGELLGQSELEKLRIEISQLDSSLKIKAQASDQAFARREAEEKQKLFETIQAAVKRVADAEGYDMVIDIQALQFAKPEYNLSDKVISQLR